jgi:20S proteasome alpha/beta subunit
VASSGTVIAGLVYQSGVLIGADSQASDLMPDLSAGVRWPVSKLQPVGKHPVVVGFSGSIGTHQRLFAALDAHTFYAKQFASRRSIQNELDEVYHPEYVKARERSKPPITIETFADIAILGLAAVWAEDGGALLEHEVSGDSVWHYDFQAIGSGKVTAHAVYRAVGGAELCQLSERTAIDALLRILQTSIAVEMAGVAEPIRLWRVDSAGAYQYGKVELDHHRQLVEMWQARDRELLFASDRGEEPSLGPEDLTGR